ncbi:hypothetical protein K437DRAFT_49689 [Tilletiaria anomala UBC 951]|uniref:Uncharacterized protein n=1 Tax=Tilletiaria anomala (strain ATCC 24038 / CBS 436.72 / UBC 951) TaxID=1037660 RepID=A0A066WFU7_TILAU|nr:uncharacterized protein K437DRAFT_49689 [Tilletiaria anomala UBC 951]KDN51373.1 hypothetical protein K437DRAFT_49689 [Tilletiaria anomala UBC 951]
MRHFNQVACFAAFFLFMRRGCHEFRRNVVHLLCIQVHGLWSTLYIRLFPLDLDIHVDLSFRLIVPAATNSPLLGIEHTPSYRPTCSALQSPQCLAPLWLSGAWGPSVRFPASSVTRPIFLQLEGGRIGLRVSLAMAVGARSRV